QLERPRSRALGNREGQVDGPVDDVPGGRPVPGHLQPLHAVDLPQCRRAGQFGRTFESAPEHHGPVVRAPRRGRLRFRLGEFAAFEALSGGGQRAGNRVEHGPALVAACLGRGDRHQRQRPGGVRLPVLGGALTGVATEQADRADGHGQCDGQDRRRDQQRPWRCARVGHRCVRIGGGRGAHRARCTTGHVSVRVMPSTFWTLATTSWPRSSTLSASARTMTSYGPVTSSELATPGSPAISAATDAALPTSVWMRMYACTTARPFVRMSPSGLKIGNVAATYRRRGTGGVVWRDGTRTEPGSAARSPTSGSSG